MVSTSTQAKQSDSKAAEFYIVQLGSSGLGIIRDRLELTISQEAKSTWCPEKNAPEFLLNFSGCKHARRLGHNSLERWDP